LGYWWGGQVSQKYKYEVYFHEVVLGVVARCEKTEGRASITNKKRRRHERVRDWGTGAENSYHKYTYTDTNYCYDGKTYQASG